MSGLRLQSLHRLQNCRRLVDELKKRSLSRDEMAAFLKYSKSGTRKYIFELTHAKVILEVARIGHGKGRDGQGVYAVGLEADVKAYFGREGLSVRTSPPPAKGKTAYALAQRDARRQFHVMQDDCAYTIKVARKQTLVDPLALPADFFKPSPDFVERRQAERAPVPAPTGFAALDVHFSRRRA